MIILPDGPEIVFVDIEKYKVFNVNKTELELIINTCWFSETQQKTENVSIEIVWKGYLYIIPINNILQNFNCCDNTVLKIRVDLINNNLTYEEMILVPVVTLFGNIIGQSSMSYGYLKMFKSDLEKLNINVNNNEIRQVLIDKTGLKTTYLITDFTANTAEDVFDSIENYLTNTGLLTTNYNIKVYRSMIESIVLSEWKDTFILNNERTTIFNIAQAIIKY